MGRIFVVRVNLDAMGAELDTLYTAEQKADWMTGFRSGSRGSVAPESAPAALLMGNCFGLGCHAEAANFSAQRSTAGKASAQRRANICSTAGQHMFNGKPNGEVNQPSAFSLQPLSNQPTANIPPVCFPVSIGPTQDQLDICLAITPPPKLKAKPVPRTFLDFRMGRGDLFIGKDKGEWERAFALYDWDAMVAMYAKLTADKRERVYFTDAIKWLSDNFTLLEEDHARANA